MPARVTIFLIVFVGGGIGSMLRHIVNQACSAAFGTKFPYGTLAVNLAGSIAIGALAEWFALRGHGDQHVRLFIITGVIGGFTTFSAFSLDAVLLWERGDIGGLATYVALSIAGAMLGVLFGIVILRNVLS